MEGRVKGRVKAISPVGWMILNTEQAGYEADKGAEWKGKVAALRNKQPDKAVRTG